MPKRTRLADASAKQKEYDLSVLLDMLGVRRSAGEPAKSPEMARVLRWPLTYVVDCLQELRRQGDAVLTDEGWRPAV
jgi:hypothetical protein